MSNKITSRVFDNLRAHSTLLFGVGFAVSMAANSLLLRYLGMQNFPSSASLSLRGLSCLLCVIAFAGAKKQTLIPKGIKFQGLRALLAAFSLLAIIQSYHFVHASTVALLQRLDIVVLCLAGFHQSAKSKANAHLWGILAAFALMALVLREPDEGLAGYLLASMGSVGLAAGYIIMKKSQSRESFAVTMAVPSLSCLLVGAALNPAKLAAALNNPLMVFAILSGVAMFGSYYFTLKLYERMNIATAEFPTLFTTTLIMPLESLLFGQHLHAGIFIFDLGIIAWLSWILGVAQQFRPAPAPA